MPSPRSGRAAAAQRIPRPTRSRTGPSPRVHLAEALRKRCGRFGWDSASPAGKRSATDAACIVSVSRSAIPPRILKSASAARAHGE